MKTMEAGLIEYWMKRSTFELLKNGTVWGESRQRETELGRIKKDAAQHSPLQLISKEKETFFHKVTETLFSQL